MAKKEISFLESTILWNGLVNGFLYKIKTFI